MNTVRALECLAFTALSTSELADSIQVSVRTARRLLQRLMLEGFVTHAGGPWGRYHATLRLAALGRQMLDHHPLVQAAAPRVAQLAQDTRSVAHFWIPGYDKQVVCAVHADARTACPEVSLLREAAPSSAAGTVLLRDRTGQRSSCYAEQSTEPTFAAAVLLRGRLDAARDERPDPEPELGHVVGALGLSGERALDATDAVVKAAAWLSADLGSRPAPSGWLPPTRPAARA